MKFSLLTSFLLSVCMLCLNAQPSTPGDVRVFSYDSHVELKWAPSSGASITNYRIFRSEDEGDSFQQVAQMGSSDTLFIDFIGPDFPDLSFQYQVTAVDAAGRSSERSNPVSASTRPMSDEAFLDMVQEYTFRYFWEFGHPESGLARERNTSGDLVTMGGSGFGIMAILVGIERGYISWEQGLDRILKMVVFLERADRFKGVYPHWMNGETGRTIRFSQFDDGGDVVETAFLLQGLLTARKYFSGESVDEIVLRTKINGIWEAIDWNWYRKQNQNVIFWHWSPEHQFRINLPVRGYNETMMVYLLAVASPTKAVPANLYEKGWAGGNYENGRTFYDIKLPVGPNLGGPLFFAHYSYIGFDPRDIKDEYTNYFVQNRNHTLINRAYCIDNPRNFEGYGENCWGLTASDDPDGYLAHEPGGSRDNGTITPTAALSSMPYTPEESIAALKHMYREHGKEIWGPMGFYDAFNLSRNWFADSYLAIDQGPIVCMIENYRTGLLWDYFMQNEEIQSALTAIGFEPDNTTSSRTEVVPANFFQLKSWPNPASEELHLSFTLNDKATVRLNLIDVSGKPIKQLQKEQRLPSGSHQYTFELSGVESGTYYLFFETDGQTSIVPFQIIH
jgi:hypothetical protein